MATIFITARLMAALSYIARECKTGYIWIDQICINQSDIKERGQQVTLMGQIYSSCSVVLVWLGEQFTRGVTLPALMDSEWFGRAWVFQEIVLAPQSRFLVRLANQRSKSREDKPLSLDDLYDILTNLPANNVIVERYLAIVREMYNQWQWEHEAFNPAHPIERTLSRLAPRTRTSNILDRLYAFFGLHMGDFLLSPSYEMSFEQALVSTAKTIIEGSSKLDILEVVPRDRHGQLLESLSATLQRPSWVPDFSLPELVTPFQSWNGSLRRDNEPGMFTWAGHFKGDRLHTKGIIIDTVLAKVGGLDETESARTNTSQLLKKSLQSWQDCDVDQNKYRSPTLERVQNALLVEGCCDVPGDETYVQRVNRAMHGRELWYTEHGRFACWSALEEKDVICILHGASNPVVLRKTDAQTWSVLGSCHLEGWMNPWSSGKVDWKEAEGDEFVLA